MKILGGYVRLYRELTSWQWYKNPNVLRVYIHLLLNASFKDFEFEGKFFKAGEMITSRKRLSEELGISEWQVLTALDKLKSTGEITTNTTNKFTVITLKNWHKTQSEQYFFKPLPTTNPQQKHSKSTHINNKKNVNNVNNNYARPRKNANEGIIDSIDWSKMNEIFGM